MRCDLASRREGTNRTQLVLTSATEGQHDVVSSLSSAKVVVAEVGDTCNELIPQHLLHFPDIASISCKHLKYLVYSSASCASRQFRPSYAHSTPSATPPSALLHHPSTPLCSDLKHCEACLCPRSHSSEHSSTQRRTGTCRILCRKVTRSGGQYSTLVSREREIQVYNRRTAILLRLQIADV